MTARSLLRLLVAVFVYALITRLMFAELPWSEIVVRALIFGVLFQGALFIVERRSGR